MKKNNQILLDRLLQISKGKQLSVGMARRQLNPPKSLNYSKMKREAEKIDSENQKLLNRILQQ